MASAAQAPILVTRLRAGMQRPIVHNISYRPDVSAQCPLPQNTLNMWKKKKNLGIQPRTGSLKIA